ncbi:MAG: hypothetical protein IJQ50_05410 [Clostridia bacterium]|nr:hypothetical protein [Clostridia bacterium]
MCLLMLSSLVSCNTTDNNIKDQQDSPVDNEIKVGCIISEEYYFFTEQMYYMAESLDTANLLNAFDLSLTDSDAQTVWKKICSCDTEDNLIFEADSFYNFDTLNDNQKTALLKTKNIDLMLVFGTSAGVWLTQNADSIKYNYMVFASADPISAGIVKSVDERLNDKSFAHVDPERIRRQIELTYEIYKFKSIGVVYEDSDAAYSYSGIRFLEELSDRYGFEIHRVFVDEAKNTDDYDRYYQELKEAYHSLLPDIDVLYITTGVIEDIKLPWLLSEVHQSGIITVAETSESQVEYGAMMHITMSDSKEEGQFAAQTIQSYYRGTPINELNQTFSISPHISLNQTTIEKIGADVPMSIYLIADNVYKGEKHAE